VVKRFRDVQEAKEVLGRLGQRGVPIPSEAKEVVQVQEGCKDAKVGDVVLRKDETASGQTYKYAQIMGVHVRVNGKVRLADVEYKIPGETKFRVTMRLMHKLVLVVPVEEQTMDKGELPGGEGETHRGGQGSPTGGAKQTPEGESGEVAEEQTLVL
jgi:hypothetical protein